jgi:antitoxin (DNA-binding transcriptional repressor) of toxin-antitoxin stability system
MVQIAVAEAQLHLPELIASLKPGEEVQILSGDRTVARLIAELQPPPENHDSLVVPLAPSRSSLKMKRIWKALPINRSKNGEANRTRLPIASPHNFKEKITLGRSRPKL